MSFEKWWYARGMEPLDSTRKLFHVIVVLGMGTAAGVAGCSSDTTTEKDAAVTPQDAAKDTSATVDAAPKPDGNTTADACAGWAPCC